MNSMVEYSVIAAISKNYVIGDGAKILWYMPEDFKLFKKATMNNVVIMGRVTWESLPKKFRPLPNRTNIILTRDLNYKAEGGIVCPSIDNALKEAKKYKGEIFVIGGSKIYEQMIDNATYLYISHVKKNYEGDIYFPKFNKDNYKIIEEKEFEDFTFRKYKKKK